MSQVDVSDETKAKAKVSAMLLDLLKNDAKQMRSVASKPIEDGVWDDLTKKIKNKQKREALRKQIASRITAGEDQIVSQPLDF